MLEIPQAAPNFDRIRQANAVALGALILSGEAQPISLNSPVDLAEGTVGTVIASEIDEAQQAVIDDMVERLAAKAPVERQVQGYGDPGEGLLNQEYVKAWKGKLPGSDGTVYLLLTRRPILQHSPGEINASGGDPGVLKPPLFAHELSITAQEPEWLASIIQKQENRLAARTHSKF